MTNSWVLPALRISDRLHKLLKEASEETGIKMTDLARFLLVRGIKKMKEDSVKAGGYENLEISIKRL